jgi:membrane glycosyltransferase
MKGHTSVYNVIAILSFMFTLTAFGFWSCLRGCKRLWFTRGVKLSSVIVQPFPRKRQSESNSVPDLKPAA